MPLRRILGGYTTWPKMPLRRILGFALLGAPIFPKCSFLTKPVPTPVRREQLSSAQFRPLLELPDFYWAENSANSFSFGSYLAVVFCLGKSPCHFNSISRRYLPGQDPNASVYPLTKNQSTCACQHVLLYLECGPEQLAKAVMLLAKFVSPGCRVGQRSIDYFD